MGQNLCWYYFDLLWRWNNQPVPICTDLIPPTPSAGGKMTIEISSTFLLTKPTISRLLDVAGVAWLDRRHRMPSVWGKVVCTPLAICKAYTDSFRMQVHRTLVHLRPVIVTDYVHGDMMLSQKVYI